MLTLLVTVVRAQSYQQGVSLTVYPLPAGASGLPAAFPPAGSPLFSSVLQTPFCARLADCFTDGSGRAHTQNVAALITGELWTPVDGMYSLFLTSTADSRLDLNGQRALDVNDCATAYLDGSCAGEERSITFWLPGQRWHPIRIEYWNGASTAGSLTLEWSGRDIPRQRVPQTNLRTLAPSGAAPSPPPFAPPTNGCPVVGSISLALATATDPTAAHATCFARFAVQVDSSCRLEVVPAPGASRWQYSSLWSAVPVPQHSNMRGCPTLPISGGTLDTARERTPGGVAAAIQAALSSAMFAAPSGADAYSTISGVELAADSLVVTTAWPPNRLVFVAVSGSLGSTIAAGSTACTGAACVWNPATGCPPGRQRILAGTGFICALCPPGSSCVGGSAAPVACATGRAATTGSATCSACAPGSSSGSAGMSHCSPCSYDWYQPSAAQTDCRPCPPGSYAHFPGSTVCVACYFGKAVVMADGNGVYTSVTAEQPSHGFIDVVTSPASPLANSSSCAFSPWASACESLSNRTLTIETDPSCAVAIAVLGDSGCSQPDRMTLLQGVYADASTILARLPDDPSTSLSLRLSQTAAGWSMALFQLTTAFDTAPGSLGSCTDVLTAPPSSCPPGTVVDSNPQAGDGITLYKASQCVPCSAGYKCADGQATGCDDTLLNTVLGAAECDTCPTVNITDPSCGSDCSSDTDPVLPTAINFCAACPAGYWAAVPGRDECQPCPAGTYRRYGMVSTQCWSCPPGSFSAAGVSSCTLCEPGTATAAPDSAPDPTTGGCPAW
ncbi:serine threonine [Chlorella sorokiniana]|uniref:Serine threonine n=1 Tax=Chlorella sorokiniana TaxID=3076 RepID=A0A2P6TZ18_CHLSO|nr:serine threonine [Chlorella sorokiniana]|eukprot:PRW59309.1 serine threonine [Chlorella sorokiniana]